MTTRNKMAASILNANELWRRTIIDNDKGEIVNNVGTLRHEDFLMIQDTVVKVRRKALNGVEDLRAAGLSFPASITDMIVGFENINEFQPAKRSMNPTNLQDNNTDFAPAYAPLPITHQGWRIPWRQEGFAYKNQLGLSESVRQVGESLEDMLFNGDTSIVVNFAGANQTLFGYTTHPDIETATISDWSDIDANRTAIITESVEMVGQLYNSSSVIQPNSIIMYVATDIWTGLQEDSSTAKGDRTLLERIKAITEIMDVKPSISLASEKVLLVEMSERTIQMATASDIVTIPHIKDSAIDDQVFTTYAAMTPLIKSDRNSKTGILLGAQ